MSDPDLDPSRPFPGNKLSVVAGYLYNQLEDPKGLSFNLVEVGVLSPADLADINEERGDYKARACLVQKLLFLSQEEKVRQFEEVLSKQQPRVAAGMRKYRKSIYFKIERLTRRDPSAGYVDPDADSGLSTRAFRSPTQLTDDLSLGLSPRKGFVEELVNEMLGTVNLSDLLPRLADKGFLTGEEKKALSADLEDDALRARGNLFFLIFNKKKAYELSQIINLIIEAQPSVLPENSERYLLEDVRRSITEHELHPDQESLSDSDGECAAPPAWQLSSLKARPLSVPIPVPEPAPPVVISHADPIDTGMTKTESSLVVLGATCVGKSTLVNSLFGDNLAKVGSNVFGTTRKVRVYTQNVGEAVLKVTDTVGYGGTTPVDNAAKDGFPLGADSCAVRTSGLIIFCSQVTDCPRIEFADRLAIQHLKNEYGDKIFERFIVVLTKANLLLQKRREDYKTFIQDLTEGWFKMLSDLLGEAMAGRIRVVAAGKDPGERLCDIDWYSELWLSCSEHSSREHSRALWQIATAKGEDTRLRSGSTRSHLLARQDLSNRTTPQPTQQTAARPDTLTTVVTESHNQPGEEVQQPGRNMMQGGVTGELIVVLPNPGGSALFVKLTSLTQWLLDTAGDREKPGFLDKRTLPVAILIAAAQGAVIGGTAGALVGFGVGAGAGVFVGILAGVLLYLFRKYNLVDTTTAVPVAADRAAADNVNRRVTPDERTPLLDTQEG